MHRSAAFCIIMLLALSPALHTRSSRGERAAARGDSFPLNRTELGVWDYAPAGFLNGGMAERVTLPGYWRGVRECSFSREVAIPTGMKGKAVFFQAVADTGGEIFIDGESRGTFGSKGRLLLTGRASGGETFRITLKCALSKPFGVFADASLISLDAGLLPLYQKIAHLERATASFTVPASAEWKFNPVDDRKFGAPAHDDSSWEAAPLPHYRANSFSWAWYRARVLVPAEIGGHQVDGAAISLRFVVNDHCEVYVRGRRMGYFRDQGHVTLAEKAKPGEAIPVALRVRNNFGKGGLLKTQLVLKRQGDAVAEIHTRLREFITRATAPGNIHTSGLSAANVLADRALLAVGSRSALQVSRSLAAVRTERARLESLFAREPLITKGPYLQNPSPTSMTVMWETCVPADTRLQYGTDARHLREIRVPGKRVIHRARLTRLARGTKYFYRVLSGGTSSELFTFATEPVNASNYTFLVWGDTRDGAVEQEKVINAMPAAQAAFAVNMGDVVGTGARKEWGPDHFTPIRTLARSVPTYVVPGNHEYYSMDGRGRVPWFETYLEQPGNEYWFSFDYGNGHFIVLDSNKSIPADMPPGSEQYRWLVKDLESAACRNAGWRFVFMHHPLYTSSWSGEYYDGEPLLRERLRPLFERHGIDMVFHGHTHAYEFGRLPKGNGVAYVITGGGGSPLDDTVYREWEHVEKVEFKYHYCSINVDGRKLRFSAVDANGKVFDSREFVK